VAVMTEDGIWCHIDPCGGCTESLIAVYFGAQQVGCVEWCENIPRLISLERFESAGQKTMASQFVIFDTVMGPLSWPAISDYSGSRRPSSSKSLACGCLPICAHALTQPCSFLPLRGYEICAFRRRQIKNTPPSGKLPTLGAAEGQVIRLSSPNSGTALLETRGPP
jgi:hypothetical protein